MFEKKFENVPLPSLLATALHKRFGGHGTEGLTANNGNRGVTRIFCEDRHCPIAKPAEDFVDGWEALYSVLCEEKAEEIGPIELTVPVLLSDLQKVYEQIPESMQ